MQLQTTAYKHQLLLQRDEVSLFMMPYQISVDGGAVFADEVAFDGGRVEAHFGDSLIKDEYTFESGLITVRRVWRLQGAFRARLMFSAMRRATPQLWAMPGALYRNLPPGTEFSASRMETQCTVPSMLFLQDEKIFFALFTQPAQKPGDVSSVRGHVGDTFSEAAITCPGSGGMSAERGLHYERTFYLLYGEPGPWALRRALERAWELLAYSPPESADWSAAAVSRLDVLRRRFFIERVDAVGFVSELTPWMFPTRAMLDGSGPGGCVAASRAMFQAAQAAGDVTLKSRALDIADFFLEGFESHESTATQYLLASRRWRTPEPGPDHDRAAGQFIHEYLRFYDTARRTRDHNPRWLRACRRWAAQRKTAQKEKTSEASSPNSATALLKQAFVMRALLGLERHYRGAGYLHAAERLALKLLPLCRHPAHAAAAAAPDAETARALMLAFLDLHKLTGSIEHLEAADEAAGILLGYTYCAGAPFPENSGLGRAQAPRAGAVVLAPDVQQLSPAPARFALALLRLHAALGGDNPWRRVALSQLEFTAALTAEQGGPLCAWPGCGPAAMTVDGHTGGQCAAATAAMLSSLIALADEFPDTARITWSIPEQQRTIKASFGRAMLHAGCFLNFSTPDD